jgi:catecholate siderophore receptor
MRMNTPLLARLSACLLAVSATTPAAAQTTTPAAAPAATPPLAFELNPVTVRSKADSKSTVRATDTRIGKGEQALRDVPQSITVVTEKLLDDRNLDTLKETLKTTAGISFQAAEGGEEDIRLRGFSLQATGDIFIDGMRDPAFYERDSFNWDRLEVLRGSASMLFGRGSTGGAVNQVSKTPGLLTRHEVGATLGNGAYLRGTGDFNWKTGPDAALRVNVMSTLADNAGNKLDKRGIAPTYRWGIGQRDEFLVGLYALDNDNGMHYGLPWLTPGPGTGGNYLWPTNPKNYYGAASDINRTGTTQGFATHIHRFEDDSELRSQLRVAHYDRDQRASAIRFAPAAQQPGSVAITSDSFGAATVLTRGSNNKIMSMDTLTAQSDYSGRHRWFGLGHSVQAGVDVANEKFENLGASLPAGTTLTKPVTRVGTPNDGGAVDESVRILTPTRSFDARALGLYVQNLVELSSTIKLLAGLRWDRFDGAYQNLATTPPAANNPCGVQPLARIERTDSLFSHRVGLLFQPSATQSYHASYGTSFNTSGDTYQFDPGTAKVDPEASRNIEIGAKLDWADGRFTTRVALFRSTKFNERNRDADSVNACNYVLSGERHAQGFELDLAGRITAAWEVWGSYAYIPLARVDASSGAAGTETVGSRPGLTPRHSGSLWSTYKLSPSWRIGAGLNARSGDRPVGLPATSAIVAPRFITADLMGEYTQGDLAYKLNVTNVADKHYADTLYRGHYVPGKPRTVQATVSYTFW